MYGCFTTIGVLPVTPSTVAATVAAPAETAVTLPAGLTVATLRVAAAVGDPGPAEVDERLVVVDRLNHLVSPHVLIRLRGVVGDPGVAATQSQGVARGELNPVGLHGHVVDARRDPAADLDAVGAGHGGRVGAHLEPVAAVVDDLLALLLVVEREVARLDLDGDRLPLAGLQHLGLLEADQPLGRQVHSGNGRRGGVHLSDASRRPTRPVLVTSKWTVTRPSAVVLAWSART